MNEIEEMAQNLFLLFPSRNLSEEECRTAAEWLISKGWRKQKVGRWTFSENGKTMKCTVCRLRMKTYDVRRYCPNFGAKMEGDSDA